MQMCALENLGTVSHWTTSNEPDVFALGGGYGLGHLSTQVVLSSIWQLLLWDFHDRASSSPAATQFSSFILQEKLTGILFSLSDFIT